ncbi:hypothetical protein KRX19_03255 [Cardiobacteriaceae bacterium TAE3-ERU3]|nr:hypothetical protein [Cardiobacteriaceae bacterium TAE3-ERU3]
MNAIKTLLTLIALLLGSITHAESLYDPTRLAYVASSAIPNIAVVDLQQGKQIDTIAIPVAAKIFAASTDSPYLAFSDKFTYAVYVVNLQTREITRYNTPSTVFRIIFVPNTNRIALVLRKNIAYLDHKKGELTVIDKDFQDLYTRFNTIFSIYSQTFWVLQENTPIIYRYRLDKPQDGWAEIDIGDTRSFGMGAPSFEDKVIAFNTYYADEGIIYFNDSGKTIHTGPMYNSRPLNEPMVEPYIDNATRHIIFGDKSGHLKIYDISRSDEPVEFNVGFPPNQFRSGWLDQYLIVGGDEHLGIYPFDDLDNGTVFTFGYEEDIADMWVSGDSKLLLFGTERSSALGRYDLQQQRRLPDIPLTGIAEVGKIRMTTTNTVCY